MANLLLRLLYPNLKPDDPCPHMRKLVSDAASGTLTGWAQWYTDTHVRGCANCSHALAALDSLRADLGTLQETAAPPLEETRRAVVTAGWDKVDAQLSGSSAE